MTIAAVSVVFVWVVKTVHIPAYHPLLDVDKVRQLSRNSTTDGQDLLAIERLTLLAVCIHCLRVFGLRASARTLLTVRILQQAGEDILQKARAEVTADKMPLPVKIAQVRCTWALLSDRQAHWNHALDH